jgi:hypothetical protein
VSSKILRVSASMASYSGSAARGSPHPRMPLVPRLQPVKFGDTGRAHRLNLRVVTVRLPTRSRATTRIVWRAARKRSALIHTKNCLPVTRRTRLPGIA